jgi:hypothetical protein
VGERAAQLLDAHDDPNVPEDEALEIVSDVIREGRHHRAEENSRARMRSAMPELLRRVRRPRRTERRSWR